VWAVAVVWTAAAAGSGRAGGRGRTGGHGRRAAGGRCRRARLRGPSPRGWCRRSPKRPAPGGCNSAAWSAQGGQEAVRARRRSLAPPPPRRGIGQWRRAVMARAPPLAQMELHAAVGEEVAVTCRRQWFSRNELICTLCGMSSCNKDIRIVLSAVYLASYCESATGTSRTSPPFLARRRGRHIVVVVGAPVPSLSWPRRSLPPVHSRCRFSAPTLTCA